MADPNPDGKFGIPGGAQVWAAPDNYWYVAYTVPGTQTPLLWRIDNNDDVAKIFGGNTPKPDRTLSAEEWATSGALRFGSSRQLANLSEHPFDAFVANYETEAKIRPWLKDPEVLAVLTRGVLEGRQPTDAEWADTEWWKTHTEGERQWFALSNKDPATAKQRVQDSRDATRRLMVTAGIANAPEWFVETMADRITGGTWTPQFVQSQIAKIADPSAPGTLDPIVQGWLNGIKGEGTTLDTLANNVTKVDALVKRWLGPAFAAGWTREQKERWAGTLRNDPEGEDKLVEELKRQRLAVMPGYENPELSYEDIAAPWRSVFQSQWGQMPDDADPLFQKVLGLNDLDAATNLLRKEGLARGVGTVVQGALSSLGQALGNGQRRAI